MDENQNPLELPETNAEPKIIVNEYGATKDSAVVIEEATRTVLLTEDETIVIEKEPRIDLVPRNRPRKIYGGMWGPMEIATVGLGMLAILATIILFVLVVLPAKKDLEKNKAERDRVETELTSARNKYGNITDTETHVAKLITSVNDFETRYLRNPLLDKTALYQRVNALIAAYGLVNTAGPDYAPLEISADNRKQESEAERGRAKFQSLFPGIYITTTVEGSYQNLRRFIREIETSDQFVVISSIEFIPAEREEKNDLSKPLTQAQPQINNAKLNPTDQFGQMQNPAVMQTAPDTQQIKAPRGKTHGETVSLRLEMAAYFRRPTAQAIEVINK